MKTKKIMLGTAQLGMNYGIANTSGQVCEDEVTKILSLAQSMQINAIDTATAYGESEKVLGKHANQQFRITTKLSPLSLNSEDISIEKQLQLSLDRLQRESCEGLLVHHANDLLGPSGEQIYRAIDELKKGKKINKIGASVYSPEQARALIDKFHLDIIQFPLNLFDQRFLQNNFLSELKERNIELHARSIFLQGLLLMTDDKVPAHFNRVKPLLNSLREECQYKNISLRAALIEFVTSINEIDYYIFGIDNHNQLEEIIHDVLHCNDTCTLESKKYLCDDLDIINPMNWKMA